MVERDSNIKRSREVVRGLDSESLNLKKYIGLTNAGFPPTGRCAHRFTDLHNQFKDVSGIKFTKLEENLLRFHCSNLEYACGSNLGNISALYWDQNEEYPQFHGPPVLIQDDFGKVLNKLAEGLNIVTKSQVNSVEYGEDVITVGCSSGEKFLASRVLLQFPSHFWRQTIKGSTMFGQILSTSTTPGLFDVFYDVSQDDQAMLATYISSDAVEILKKKRDAEIIQMCIDTLKAVFPKQDVPQPTKYYVSRWYKMEHVGMSYSYIPTNCGAGAFDNMEQDLDNKIFFAGEATHKQYHQTLAGAYMSGIRVAEKTYRAYNTVT